MGNLVKCLSFLFLLGISTQQTSGYFYEEYITQPLHPMDSFNQRNWQNRFFIDRDSYVEGGPIFVSVAGPDFYNTDLRMNLSHFHEIGRDMGAVMVFTEYRFFGQSRPTEDTSLNNLQYLDSRNALADVAHLVEQLKVDYDNAPVIAHGFDQGGALAVWLRQNHPHLVDGVWAASPALEARMDFGEYLVNIGLSIRSVGGDQCYQDVEEAFSSMGRLYSNRDFSVLEEHFNLCTPFTGEDPIEEGAFMSFFALGISEILRYSHSFGIETLCQYLDMYEDPMEGVASFVRLVVPVCIPIDVNRQIEIYQQVEWDTDSTDFGGRQLSYQLCKEFGWFRSSSYPNQPFGDRFPISLFYEQCSRLFGDVFTEGNIFQMIVNTNNIWGGNRPNVTNVYFTDGELDPGRVVGVLEEYGPEIFVDLIPNFGAGAEILLSETVTSDDVRRVQARARELIENWVAQARLR